MPLPTKEQIFEALKPVQDPEMQLSVVDLGLIYDLNIEPDGKIQVKMTLTTPGCPYGETLIAQTRQAIQGLEGVTEVDLNLVWDPPWDPNEMASDHAKDVLGIW